MSEATPRPWEYIGLNLACRDAYQRDIEPPQEGMKIIDASGAKLFEDWFNGAEQDEMWKLIVRAVNNHDALRRALFNSQRAIESLPDDALGTEVSASGHHHLKHELLAEIQAALDAAKGDN